MSDDARLDSHVAHMLESVELALSYVEGLSQSDFLADRKTQQAAILNLIVIGETAAKIERDFPAFASAQSHIPWKSMRGMRNRIAHGYFEIDLSHRVRCAANCAARATGAVATFGARVSCPTA